MATFRRFILSSEYISISRNAIHYNNGYGIWLRDNVRYCNIILNGIVSNQNYGVFVGRESDSSNPSSNLNFVNQNTFENNNQNNSDQAGNWGENNEFSQNHWNNWMIIDTNNDGWVDSPYPIAGPFNTFDYTPKTTRISPNLVLPLIITFPNGGETVEGEVIIEWTPKSSPLESGDYYSIEISKDGNNWIQLITNLNETSFPILLFKSLNLTESYL